MRILHLNPFFFPYAGGIERRILEVGKRHARLHDVHVLTAQLENTALEETIEGMRVHRLPSTFTLKKHYNPPLVKTPGLTETIEAIAPDVIDFHFRWSPSYAKAFRKSDAARVFTYHNTFGEGSGALGFFSRMNDRWTRGYIAESHRIVAISKFIWDDLKKNGFPEDRFALVPNGVDAHALRKEAQSVDEPMENTLVAVGRLVRVKGYDNLIRALPQMPAEVRLVICGEGPEKEPLQRLATELGVGSRVRIAGWVPEPQKLGMLQKCLAFVHPARFEAFGLSPLEAMAMGAPVIGTRIGGLPEVVGDAGILVDPEDPLGIAHAVQRLRSDPELRQRLTRAAADQANRFNWNAVAVKLLRIYEQAAAMRT
ncbi:MAG TPA: glycosyltransferase family 4 protein [Candidatus Thermoplasmatota archaeon]|nr:glycosyltransferase family 4 protein [Candidatus Thermoplasmatota archaeon]